MFCFLGYVELLFVEGLFFIKWFLLVIGGVVIVIILLVLLCYYCWKMYICFSKNVGEFFNSCIIFCRMLRVFSNLYYIYFLIECYNMKIVKSLINKLILFMILIYFCYGLYIFFFFYRIVFIFKGFFDIFE